MGAYIKVEGNSAIIDGVKKLTGARVSAPDLRAGAALVIAGLAADGITVVDDIVYIQSGYENFEEVIAFYSEWWRYKGSMKPRQPLIREEGANLSE